MRSRSPWGRCKQAGVCAAPRPRAMRIRWRRGAFGDRSGAAVAEQPRETATGEAGTGPGGARNLGVPRAPWVNPDAPHSEYVCNPTPDREPRDHPRPDTSRLSPPHASHTHPQRVPNGGGQALRFGEQIRKACRFGEGWPGDLRAIQLLLNWRRQSPASPVRIAGTGVQRVRLSFP